MQPLEEAGPRSQLLGCGRTLVGPPRDRLRVIGSWVGLDPPHVGARPRIGLWMGFSIYFLCAFLLTPFAMVIEICGS